MPDNYAQIVRNNLEALFSNLPGDFSERIGARPDADGFVFRAFGKECRIAADGILLDGEPRTDVIGILISLYGLNARPEPLRKTPLAAFKEFPDSMPYTGAFATHTERILTPHAAAIRSRLAEIRDILDGEDPPEGTPGDFALFVRPLPKIMLCYIFYEADEDFPASAVCLYSRNANRMMPIDGLADVGEYTSRRIIEIIS